MDHGRRVGGYFSVEAALVLPVVLGEYLFLITMLFVQYDRCLLEQDMASMLIKACNHSGTSRQQLTYLQELTAAWDREQYLWLELQSPHFTVQGRQICLETAGEFVMPGYGGLSAVAGLHRLEVSFRLNAWDRPALVRLLYGNRAEEKDDFQKDNREGS